MSLAYRTGASWVQRNVEYLYDPIKGAQTATTYEADVTGLNYLLNQLRPYQRVSVSGADAPRYTITVYSPEAPTGVIPPQSETDPSIWEVLANYKELDIYEWAASEGIPMDDIIKIQNFVRKPIPGSSPAVSGYSVDLWNLVQYRHLKHAVEDIVFRYQYVISNAVETTLAYAHRDELFSNAQLINPSYSGLFIPAGTIASLNAAYAAAPPIPANFKSVWSWLKRAPTSRQTIIGKVVITGEYWLQAWSTFEYPLAFPGGTELLK